MKDIQR